MQLLNPIFRATSKIRHRLDRMQEQVLNMSLSRIMLFAAGKRETAYCVHLVVAALCFSPFLLFGQTLFANSDLLLHNYPMILLAKREFLSGSLGLWNPYAFFGTPQSVAASTHILNPENWLLFLLPERYLFSAYTFSMFIKLWLVGAVSYHFFCAELLNRRWALFASLTYQLSGWILWALVSSVALSIYFYYTILLALLWTFARRSLLKNYLLLTTVLVMMLMAGNVAHASYALLSVGFFFCYRAYSRRNVAPFFTSLAVFASIVVTAMLVFSIRLLPILNTLASGSRDICLGACHSDYKDTSVLLARLFDTEIFGVSYWESMIIFKAISPVLKDYQIHGAMPAFFGVAPMLLAIWALVSEKSPKAVFWSICTVVILGLIIAAKPFDEFGLMLFSNFLHPIGWQLTLPVGFSVLAALGGMSLEKSLRHDQIPRSALQLFIFVACLSLLLVLMILIRNAESLLTIDPRWTQFFVGGLFAMVALIIVARRRYPQLVRIFFESTLWCLVALCLAFIFLFVDTNPTFTSHVKNLSISLLLIAGIAIILLLFMRGRKSAAWRLGYWGGGGAVMLAFAIFIYPWTTALESIMSHGQALSLAGIGALRLILGVAIFLLLLSAVKTKKLPARSVYVVFILILLCEQIPANKVHIHINANPFNPSSNPYPPMAPPVGVDGHPIELDLANYRVNFPNTMLQPPFYKELFGTSNEVCSGVNVAYGVRSYGGFNNTIPKKTSWFIQNWVPDAPGSFCVYAKHTDERFLDLSNVGYEYNRDTKTVAIRPNSLSRMMLFTQFEVIPDGQSASGFGPVLDRLKAPDFQPLGEIVLQESPGFQSRSSGLNGKKLEFNEIDSDHIEVHVNSDGPALLFFDDSFHPGWVAEVNGLPQKVLEADYLFMAVPVPEGESHVVLKYKPRSFTIGLYCALVGIAVWMIAFVAYWIRRKPNVPNQRGQM